MQKFEKIIFLYRLTDMYIRIFVENNFWVQPMAYIQRGTGGMQPGKRGKVLGRKGAYEEWRVISSILPYF